MIKASDAIRGSTRGTANDALDAISALWGLAGLVWPEKALMVIRFVNEVYRIAPLVNADAAIVVTQAAHETGTVIKGRWVPFTSPRFLNNGNSGGFLIEADSDVDPATFTGVEAARVHVWALLWACGVRHSVIAIQPIPDSADAFMERWTTKYDDPNCPTVSTIDDLNIRYVDRTGEPQATWAWNADYQDKLIERGSALFPNIPGQSTTGGSTDVADKPKVTFGRVKKPKVTKAWVEKPYDGAGFTRLSKPRQPVGACDHRTYGLGDAWVTYNVFAGERLYDALTDYVVDLDGLILELNDPFGTRSPWANGGSDGLEGDGGAFVRTLGIDAINSRLVSIENVGVENTPYDGAQFEASCQLQAWIFDQAKVRFDDYPFNANVGCVTDMEHFEFATKACPFTAMRAATDRRQNRVRAILKAAQLDVEVPVAVEPEKPVENPAHELPNGYTIKGLTRRFGTLKRYHGKNITEHHFDINGPVSNAWIERGARLGKKLNDLPPATTWTTVKVNGVDVHTILFDGSGDHNWVLIKHNVGNATWQWAI